MKFNEIFQEYLKLSKPVKTIIHWHDLYENHTVYLDSKFQEELFERTVNKAGNMSELGRRLDISRKTISNVMHNKNHTSIKTLIKVAEYDNYPLEDINNKIVRIGGLKPKLPFDLHNKEGAEIRAAFLSDGHVDKNPVKPNQYCALEKELHESLIELCKKVFGEFKYKTYFNSKSHITKFPGVIGTALELSGVPRGNKTLYNPYLPKDILLGNEEICTAYLRRVFDDEGDVCNSCGKRAVRITRSANILSLETDIPPGRWVFRNIPDTQKNNLILGEQLLLLKLGIDARLYPEGIYKNKKGQISAKWRIQIGQQDQVRKFAKLINFSLANKKEKLKAILESYQYRKLPNGKGKEEALEFIRKNFKNKGFISFNDLGKEMVRTGRSYDLAGRYLKFFSENKTIRKIKRGIYATNAQN